MLSKQFLGLMLLGLIIPCSIWSEEEKKAQKEENPSSANESPEEDPTSGGKYEFREEHDPNGIGKFYLDREIAHVMGVAGVPWLERPEREDEEAPSKLVKAIKLKPGDVVADVGAGSGVLSMLFAERVGEKGKVIAIDVQQEMVDILDAKLKDKNIENIEPRLGTAKSPNLKPETVDLAIMVDVYHEFEYPYEMMKELAASLKPGGRIVFVEYRKEDPEVPIKLVHKMSVDQVKKEIGLPEFRLKYKETIDVLPRQHIIIFEKEKKPTPNRSQKSGIKLKKPIE